MKKVTILNTKTNQSFGATLENPDSWIAECVNGNYWGKSERWVRKSKTVVNELNQSTIVFPEEQYDEADVIESEIRQIENGYELDEDGSIQLDKDGVTTRIKYDSIEYVKLKGEYTVEIVDISDQIALQEKQKQIVIINAEFERQCDKIGVEFEGNFFQYSDISRARLIEVKDDIRVPFWRSVADVFIPMTNEKKNELYELLKVTYFTKFQEKSLQIDSL